MEKPKLLLHICCVGCGAYVAQVLKKEFKISLFFYNPNIWPREEYEKRREEAVRVAEEYKLDLVISDYDHGAWLKKIKGHEHDPEKGARCLICYEDRLQTTARKAQALGFDYFTTTLTVSPHKVAQAIMKSGKELAVSYNVIFLDQDFKKQDGFKKASQLSKELNLYRQNYCGCEFSRRL